MMVVTLLGEARLEMTPQIFSMAQQVFQTTRTFKSTAARSEQW
jgi:hypothetical protein